VSGLNGNVTITIFYGNNALLNSFDESSLQLYYWNATTQEWILVPSTIDTVTHTITAHVNHFSTFAVFGKLKTGAVIPPVTPPITPPIITPITPPTPEQYTSGEYIVQPGDSLQSIAQKIYGDAGLWTRLVELNQAQYPSLYDGGANGIYVGWVLKYDVGGTIPAPAPQEQAAGTYDYELVTQSPYPATLKPGETTNVWIEVKNTGTATWNDNVRLGTGSIYGNSNQQQDYASEFANSDWLSPNRPAGMSNGTNSVTGIIPGWNIRFQFTIKAPATNGNYKAYFTPVADGISWMNDIGIYWEINVNDGTIQPVQPIPTPTPAPEEYTSGEYIVQSGDSLQSIAQKIYGDAGLWTRLVELNQAQYPSLYDGGANNIYAGWVLEYDIGGIIPPTPAPVPAPTPEPTPTPQPEIPSAINGDFYTVQFNDSLKTIAGIVYGDPEQWGRLVDLNKDQYPSLATNPNFLQAGWNLRFQGEPTPVPQPAPQPSLNEPGEYTVQAGDSLKSIAQTVYGDAEQWEKLVELNQDQFPSLYDGGANVIYAGWVLKY